MEDHGFRLLAVARRYSASAADADDVYQRTLELILTRAPTDDDGRLLAWAKIVARNEALTMRRRDETRDMVTAELSRVESLEDRLEPSTKVVRDERDRQLVHALAALRPDHVRCLLLKAEGLSYQQIGKSTGFSYAKVNRCLTEGREALRTGFARVSDGSECSRLSGALSMYADGIADDGRADAVESHLKVCLSCQMALRQYRAAPGRLAAAVPLAPLGQLDISLFDRIGAAVRKAVDSLNSVAAAVNEQATARVFAVQQAAEVTTAKSAVVAVALTVSVAAGAVEVSERIETNRRDSKNTSVRVPTHETGPVTNPRTRTRNRKITPKSTSKRRSARQARTSDLERPNSGSQTDSLATDDVVSVGGSIPSDEQPDTTQLGTDTSEPASPGSSVPDPAP